MKVNKILVQMALITFVGCLTTDAAADELLADYQFTVIGDLFSSDTNSESAASDISRGPGVSGISSSNWGDPTRCAYVLGLASTNEADAITGSDYLSFTITPNSGFKLNLSEFSFAIAPRYDYSPDSYSLYAADDDGADDFVTLLGSADTDDYHVDNVFTNFTVDLSSVVFLQGVTNETTFRIYLYGTTTSNPTNLDSYALRVDNVQLRGEVLPAPTLLADYQFTESGDLSSSDTEPSSLAGDFGIGSGTSLGSSAWGDPSGRCVISGSLAATNEANAITGNDYVTFSITPRRRLNLTKFTFKFIRRYDYCPNIYSLFADEDPGGGGDNFTTRLGTGTIAYYNVDGGDFNKLVVDLSNVEFLQEIRDETTFRLYVYGDTWESGDTTQDKSTVRFDTVQLFGDVLPLQGTVILIQ